MSSTEARQFAGGEYGEVEEELEELDEGHDGETEPQTKHTARVRDVLEQLKQRKNRLTGYIFSHQILHGKLLWGVDRNCNRQGAESQGVHFWCFVRTSFDTKQPNLARYASPRLDDF